MPGRLYTVVRGVVFEVTELKKWSNGMFASLLLAGLGLAGGAPAGEPQNRPVSPRRVAPPTRIPDPIVVAPSGEAVQTAAVPLDVRRAVVADAARRFKVEASAVVLVRAEQLTWPDGSLGCPERGLMYTQALVPGYRIVAKTSAGEMLYHTDSRGQVRNCGAVSSPRVDSIYKGLQDPALPDSVVERTRESVQPRTQPPAKPLPMR